jgi:hypothetical protein
MSGAMYICDRRAPKERRLFGRKYKLFIFNVLSHNFATKTLQHLQRVVCSKNKGGVSRIPQARHAKDLEVTRIASAQRTSRDGPPRPFKMTCKLSQKEANAKMHCRHL